MSLNWNEHIQKGNEMLQTKKAHYQQAIVSQCALFHGEKLDRQPFLLNASLTDAQREFPSFNYKEIHSDKEKMLLSGMKAAFSTMNGGREAVPSIRANMGCGIVPALFGVKPMLFEDKMPWVKSHLLKDQLKEMTLKDITITPEFKMALEHMEFIKEHIEGSGCLVYPLDIQGAYDTAHILLGDAIFYEMYDDPHFVHHLLELSCEAILMAFDACKQRMICSDIIIPHYNSLVMPRDLGGIKLSEDTSTLLSKAQIEEFVAPYMKRILSRTNGGYIHYCGSNPHLYEAVMTEPLAYGLNFGNPEKHDMEQVLRDCAERNKIFYGTCAKKDEESHQDYFTRLLKAANLNGRMHLLLQYHCSLDEVNLVSDVFDEASEISN